jgi:hypothetical protein
MGNLIMGTYAWAQKPGFFRKYFVAVDRLGEKPLVVEPFDYAQDKLRRNPVY